MCFKIVVETNVGSISGKYLYSDMFFEAGEVHIKKHKSKEKGVGDLEEVNIIKKSKTHYHGILNRIIRIPAIGVVAAICKFALCILHILGHLLAALITQKRGHLYHTVKGTCEALRSSIEIIPFIGRIFTWTYSFSPNPNIYYVHQNKKIEEKIFYNENTSHWWMMKIYNQQKPDLIDKHNNLWNGLNKTLHYIKA